MENVKPNSKEIIAIRVKQWLKEWDKVEYDNKSHRRKPDEYFYIFSLSASDLKALSGIQRRTTKGGKARSKDLGIQRRHDERRSEEIYKFIKYGFPWSELSQRKRESGKYFDLRKPGWLPTALVVNILKPEDIRKGEKVDYQDLITVHESESSSIKIELPPSYNNKDWKPKGHYPIEVIDGQHRLWAFEKKVKSGEFEMPVVAFHGLDISWQAYLFWTINIKPKRINASLAFDLYPLLRTEDWLERFEGHKIYRETRAQELTEALWSYSDSPWHQRINMLGERGLARKMVSQAAWIRSLMSTYIKSWEGRGTNIGGLFGAPMGQDNEVLPWSRAEQAAFLIVVWQKIEQAVNNCKKTWASDLRATTTNDKNSLDPAFAGPHSLLNTDQGVRGILYITNDLIYHKYEDLNLMEWGSDEEVAAADEEAVRIAKKSLMGRKNIINFIDKLAKILSEYDWRTASAASLGEQEKTRKLAFRGSGGYKELRRQLLHHIIASGKGDISKTAQEVLDILGYE